MMKPVSRFARPAVIVAPLLLAAAMAASVSSAQSPSDEPSGELLETTWFAHYVDPRNDAEFLALEIESARRNDFWLLARRYRGARGEGPPYHELWRFEAGERRHVHPLPGDRISPLSRFAALRRIAARPGSSAGGGVAVGFLDPDGSTVVLVLDASGAFREWGGLASLRELGSVSALALHPDGDVTVAAAAQGVPTVVRFGADGAVRWRRSFAGASGELAQVVDLAVLGSGVAVLGIASAADEAAAKRGELKAAVVALDADGRPSDAVALPERTARWIAGQEGEVAVAMGRFQPGVAVPVAAFDLVTRDRVEDSKTGVLALERKKTIAALPTERRRNRHLAVARACGSLYAHADEEKVASHSGKHIRLVLTGAAGEISKKILSGASPEDRMILSQISLVPHGETLYVAATIVQVLESREVRSGIDIYSLDLGGVCGRGTEER